MTLSKDSLITRLEKIKALVCFAYRDSLSLMFEVRDLVSYIEESPTLTLAALEKILEKSNEAAKKIISLESTHKDCRELIGDLIRSMFNKKHVTPWSAREQEISLRETT